ncbi:peptidase family M50 [bacterium BMS3Abin04]|nr:peptidase family M50 [bacterium BMS3Abin04]
MSGIQVSEKLIVFVTFLPLFFISLAIHEFAHAYVAYKFGDSTAKKMGRLTLNPIKHIDLVGSIIMPLLSFASGFMLIGWAKPVPINGSNFKNQLRDDAIVSVAGPISNFILAFIFFLILSLLNSSFPNQLIILKKISLLGIYFNVFLFAFNLLPIPPLDGSHILFDLFPNKITAKYLSFGVYGTVILFVFIYSPLWGLFMKFVYFIVSIFFS